MGKAYKQAEASENIFEGGKHLSQKEKKKQKKKKEANPNKFWRCIDGEASQRGDYLGSFLHRLRRCDTGSGRWAGQIISP